MTQYSIDMFTAFGMVFQMVRGKAIHHVARTFPENIANAAEVLCFPEIEAPFVSVGHILTTNLVTFLILCILNEIFLITFYV